MLKVGIPLLKSGSPSLATPLWQVALFTQIHTPAAKSGPPMLTLHPVSLPIRLLHSELHTLPVAHLGELFPEHRQK
jgi:hypothetical protein